MVRSTLSLEELKKNRKPLRNVNVERKENLSSMDVFAIWITEHVGTMGFFLIIFFWTVIWLGFNTLGPIDYRFDPYPAFVLWLFISNMIQILLMPLLLIGQNLQNKHSEARAETDFELNKKAEQEIEVIISHLENQNEILENIEKKLLIKS